MAYDEGALFDTEYCKERINVLTLFHANDATGSIPGFYYSGSSETYNTLVQEDLNDHLILPDFVQKRIWEERGMGVQFYKGGSDASSSVDRVNDIVVNANIGNNVHPSELISCFHIHILDGVFPRLYFTTRMCGVVSNLVSQHKVSGCTCDFIKVGWFESMIVFS